VEKLDKRKPNKKLRNGYLILVAVFTFSFLFILTPPLFMHLGFKTAARINYISYNPFCHQLESRSLHLLGYKLGVCARCTGVYLGFLLGAVGYPLFRRLDSQKMPSKWFLIAGILPLALDGTTQLVGLRESTNMLRLVTGLLFGSVISPYLVVVIARIFHRLDEREDINR